MMNPNEDTEWNDVLRAKGIIPEKQKEAEITEDQIQALLDQTIKQRTTEGKDAEEMNLEELDEAEDDLDERVFAEYRRKRIEEMRALQKAATYGDVLEITGREWVREVNQAGQDVSVVVHLYKQGIPACALLNQHLRVLATKHPATKFVKSISDLCIPNYPDRNLPTVFVYRNGAMVKQFVGPAVLSEKLKVGELEWILDDVKAVKTDLEHDPRPKLQDTLFSQLNAGGSSGRRAGRNDSDSDNDDW